MADYNKDHEYETKVEEGGPVDTKDRGLFDFLGKKKEEEKPQEEVLATEFDKVKVSEEPAYVNYDKPAEHGYHAEEHKEEEKKHETLSEKLHRSDSSSSSSSDEDEDEEKKKQRRERREKKGLKEKIKEKISGDKEEEKKHESYGQDTSIPVEKVHEEHEHPYDHSSAGVVHHHEQPPPVVHHPEEPAPVVYSEEKKENEKKGFLEKIKDKLPGHKEAQVASPPAPPVEYEHAEPAEKKGLMDKIKEKLPGYHPKTEEEKEKPTGSY